MDRWQYLAVLGGCLVVTAPLEFLGPGVYRQPRKLARAVLPIAALLVVWDAIAIAGGVWWYDPKYLSGLVFPGGIPVEEVLFFLVVPICGLLTYNAVSTILGARASRSGRELTARARKTPTQ